MIDVRCSVVSKRCFLYVLYVLLVLYVLYSPIIAASKQTIAVLDFVDESSSDPDDDWAIGLADLMFMELQKHGAHLLERRNIQYILSERQLHNNGFINTEDLIRKKLPWVRYLLKGTITRESSSDFYLTVSVVDAQTGSLLGEFNQTGQYPAHLVPKLTVTAKHIIKKLHLTTHKPSHRSPKKEKKHSMTRVPEVALEFYKGLHYFLSGQPELAIPFFRVAHQLDPRFIAAYLWEARAYESLKLKEHAKLIYENVQRDFPKIDFSTLLKVRRQQAGKKTAAVIVPAGSKKYVEAVGSALINHLSQKKDIHVFSPQWINGLTDEMDLDLSGEFQFPSLLAGRSWLLLDWIILVRECRDRSGKKKILEIDGIEASTGRLKFRFQHPLETGKYESLTKEIRNNILSRKEFTLAPGIAKQIHKPIGITSGSNIYTIEGISIEPENDKINLNKQSNKKQPEKKKKKGKNNNGRRFKFVKNFARHLKKYASDPSDKENLMQLFADYYRIANLHTRRHSMLAHQLLLMHRLKKIVKSTDEDAAKWYSTALWYTRLIHELCIDLTRRFSVAEFKRKSARETLRLLSRLQGNKKYSKTKMMILKPLNVEFATLMTQYPKSFATLVLCYGIAVETMNKGHTALAYTQFRLVAERLQANDTYGLTDDFYINLYFFTAYTASFTRDKESSVRYLEKAYARLKKKLGSKGTPGRIDGIGATGLVYKIRSYSRKTKWFAGEMDINFPLYNYSPHVMPVKNSWDNWWRIDEGMNRLYNRLNRIYPLPFPNLFSRLFSKTKAHRPATPPEQDSVRPLDMTVYRAVFNKISDYIDRKKKSNTVDTDIPQMFRALMVLTAPKNRPAVRALARRYIKIGDHDQTNVQILLAVQDYKELDNLCSRLIEKKRNFKIFYGYAGKAQIIKHKYGELKQTQYYQQLLDRHIRDYFSDPINNPPNRNWAHYTLEDLVFRTAGAWKRLGKFSKARDIYLRGLSIRKQLKSPESQSKIKGLFGTNEPAVRFYLADTYQKLNRPMKAVEILKKLVAECKKGDYFMFHDWDSLSTFSAGIANGSDLHPCVHETALKRLEYLRVISGTSGNRARAVREEMGRAVKRGDIPTMRELIALGANINVHGNDGKTYMHWLAEKGDYKDGMFIDAARLLIKHGARLDVTDNDGRTPLHYSALYDEIRFTRLLLQKGANPNIRDKMGFLPHHLPAYRGYIGIVALLLDHGAQIEAKSDETRGFSTALHLAAGKGRINVAHLLLERGANVDSFAITRITPLSWAASLKGNIDMVRFLVSRGANPHHKDEFHHSALYVARKKNNREIIRYLSTITKE